MEFKLKNVDIIFSDEDEALDRELLIRKEDESIYYIDLVDTVLKKDASICLNMDQVKILRDYLSLIIKNK